MSSDFPKDALDVERHYTSNWFTNFVSYRLKKYDLKHRTPYSYKLAEWLVGICNVLRSASPRDGYEWIDRRTSKWSQMDDVQKAREINQSIAEKDGI